MMTEERRGESMREKERCACVCVIDRRKTEIAGVGLYSFFVGDLEG